MEDIGLDEHMKEKEKTYDMEAYCSICGKKDYRKNLGAICMPCLQDAIRGKEKDEE